MTDMDKHTKFLGGSMKGKLVTDLPGINEMLAKKLNENELPYKYAHQLFGEFLLKDKNKIEFREFLRATCGANQKQASDCFNCLMEWSQKYL